MSRMVREIDMAWNAKTKEVGLDKILQMGWQLEERW